MRSKGTTVLAALVAVLAVGAVSAAPALAGKGLPVTETEEATAVTKTTATLHGKVDPNGSETTYWFEYGVYKEGKAAYETKTAETVVGSGEAFVHESNAVTGLKTKTEYDVRIVAKSSKGTSYGEAELFTTGLPEFVPGKGQSFPIVLENKLHGGYASIEPNASFPNSCGEDRTKAEITGAKAVSVTLEWTGCKGGAGEEFHSKGAPAGTIVIPGSGTLVYIDRATKQVGIALTLKEAISVLSGTTSAFSIESGVIIPITPVGAEIEAGDTFDLPIHEKSESNQEFTSYENESSETELLSPRFCTSLCVRAGIEVTGANELATSKALEIKA
jgi:hypothetical protein